MVAEAETVSRLETGLALGISEGRALWLALGTGLTPGSFLWPPVRMRFGTARDQGCLGDAEYRSTKWHPAHLRAPDGSGA